MQGRTAQRLRESLSALPLTETVGDEELKDPELLDNFVAFFHELPPESQDSINKRIKKPHVQLLKRNPSPPPPITISMEREYATWFGSEILRDGDPATRLFLSLQELSNPSSTVDSGKRSILLIEFHIILEKFDSLFQSTDRVPLASYLCERLSLPKAEVNPNCKTWSQGGHRGRLLAQKLDGVGALLLPRNIARSTLEKHMPPNGPRFDKVVQTLRDQGVCKSERTKWLYEVASAFLSYRESVMDRFLDSLYSAFPSPTGRINIRENPWPSPVLADLPKGEAEAVASLCRQITSISRLVLNDQANEFTPLNPPFINDKQSDTPSYPLRERGQVAKGVTIAPLSVALLAALPASSYIRSRLQFITPDVDSVETGLEDICARFLQEFEIIADNYLDGHYRFWCMQIKGNIHMKVQDPPWIIVPLEAFTGLVDGIVAEFGSYIVVNDTSVKITPSLLCLVAKPK